LFLFCWCNFVACWIFWNSPERERERERAKKLTGNWHLWNLLQQCTVLWLANSIRNAQMPGACTRYCTVLFIECISVKRKPDRQTSSGTLPGLLLWFATPLILYQYTININF
jgi:hypothetical protein